jgi:MFS family permease
LFFAGASIIIATSNTYIMFIIAYIFFGLSSAMWAASGTPFFFDNLRELDREKDFKKLFGNVTAINYIIGGFGAFAGAYIATFSMRWTFWATAAAMAIASIVALTFTETKPYKHGDKRYINHLKDAVRFASRHPRVRMLIIFSAIFWGAMFSVYMLYQPYFNSLGIPLVYFGVIYLILFILGGLSAKATHMIEKHLSENDILFLVGVFSLVSILSMMFNVLIIGIIATIIMFVIWGIFETVIADYIHKHVESHHRSTVHSLNMLSSELVMTVLAPFVGWLVDFWSLTTAFMFSGGLLAANLVILTIALSIAKRKAK